MGKKPGKHPDRRTPRTGIDRVTNVGGRARQTLIQNYPSSLAIENPVLEAPYHSRTYFTGITRLLYSGAAADRLIYTSPKNSTLGFVAVWREPQPDGCTSHYAIRHPAHKGSLWASCADNDYPRKNYLQTAKDEYDLDLIGDLSAALDFTGQGMQKIRYIDETTDLARTRTLSIGQHRATAVAYESNQEGLAVVAMTHLREDTTTFLAFPANNIPDAEAMLSEVRLESPDHDVRGAIDLSLWRTAVSVETAISFLLAQIALTATSQG